MLGPRDYGCHVQWQLLFQAEVLKSADLLGVPLFFSPSQASLWSMSPPSSPTPPVLSSERILMQAEVERDVRPEWHWDTVRGM